MRAHNTAVSHIQQRVSHFHASKTQYRIFHGGTNSTRSLQLDRTKIIDTSMLTNILSVHLPPPPSSSTPTILVEPNTSMSALLAACLAHNILPKVIPELPGITVGGAYSGTSGDLASY